MIAFQWRGGDACCSGTNQAFALANEADCRRYKIVNNPAYWGQFWTREKHQLASPVDFGVLTVSADGFFFECYTLINQPHFFHNIIQSTSTDYPFHIPVYRQPIENTDIGEATLDHIVCQRGTQFLSAAQFEHFILQSHRGLKPGGTLAIGFAIFFNLTPLAVDILKTSPFLRKMNTVVENPYAFIRLDDIRKISPGFTLANANGARLAALNRDDLERWIFSTQTPIVTNTYKELFLTAYTSVQFEQVQDAGEVVITNAGMLLMKVK